MSKNKYLNVILLHRGIAAGKSRLASALDDATRAELNRWLLARTLQVVCEWLGDAGRCVVVSPCAETLALAVQPGATPLRQNTGSPGLNGAALQGAWFAASRDAGQVLLLPCDLPYLDTAALRAMEVLSNQGASAVIAPDRRGNGTNALLVDARTRDFAFGPDSFCRHLELARVQGVNMQTIQRAALAFDLDDVDDLAAWARDSDVPSFLSAYRSASGCATVV